MRNYVQPGDVLTLPAPLGGVLSGAGLKVGNIFGVAAYDAAEGEEVETEVVGVFDLPKAEGVALAVGARAYWNDVDKNITGTASGNTAVGVAMKAAPAADPVVRVRLNASF